MTRGSFLLFCMFALGLAASTWKGIQLSNRVTELEGNKQELQSQVQNLKGMLLKEHVQEETAQLAQETLVGRLEERVKQKQNELARAEERLKVERNTGSGGRQIPAFRERIDAEKRVVADLEQRLKENRTQQSFIQSQDKAFEQQATLTEKQSDQQLKTQIAEQESTLKQMEKELKGVHENIPVNPGYAEKAAELQAEIQVQKNTIQQLKEQRSSSTAQWGYQKSTTRAQNTQSLSQLKTSENQLQSQLQRERAALQALQRDVESGVQSQKSRVAVLQSARADVVSKKSELDDLQRQLREAQERLQQLGPAVSSSASPASPSSAE